MSLDFGGAQLIDATLNLADPDANDNFDGGSFTVVGTGLVGDQLSFATGTVIPGTIVSDGTNGKDLTVNLGAAADTAAVQASQVGTTAVLNITAQDTISLSNVNVSDLHQDDFNFI